MTKDYNTRSLRMNYKIDKIINKVYPELQKVTRHYLRHRVNLRMMTAKIRELGLYAPITSYCDEGRDV